MSMKKSILAFLATFVLVFYCFTLTAETGRIEIVDLGEGISAHAIVKDIIVSNNIAIQDVIDVYKSVISKAENKDLLTIVGKHEDFSIYIEPEDKTIFSIAIRRKKGEE